VVVRRLGGRNKARRKKRGRRLGFALNKNKTKRGASTNLTSGTLKKISSRREKTD